MYFHNWFYICNSTYILNSDYWVKIQEKSVYISAMKPYSHSGNSDQVKT